MAGFGRESSSSTLYGGTTTFLINLPVKAGVEKGGDACIAPWLIGGSPGKRSQQLFDLQV